MGTRVTWVGCLFRSQSEGKSQDQIHYNARLHRQLLPEAYLHDPQP